MIHLLCKDIWKVFANDDPPAIIVLSDSIKPAGRSIAEFARFAGQHDWSKVEGGDGDPSSRSRWID